MKLHPFLFGLLLPLAAACSAQSPDDGIGGEDEDITHIPQSGIKDQSDTGNCWLYATTAWAESLSAHPQTGRAKDFSTTYLVYWNFYDQILGSEKGFKGVEWTGGSWGQASELMLRYGLMELRHFTGSENEDADAKLALSALTKINTSLKRGALRTKATRKDPLAVRAELDRAFGLDPSLVATMNRVFGEDGRRTFQSGARAEGTIVAPADVKVRLPGDGARFGTLADVIGERDGDDADVRRGALAWKKASLDEERDPTKRAPKMRAFLKRVQRALHDGVPVPVSWCVEETGEDGRKRFNKAISGVQDGDCAHETLIVDYEVKLPDGRVLAADADASPEDERAALADDAQIVFLRVKNSWGAGDDAPKRGYTDLYMDYLMSTINACPDKNARSKDCTAWSFLVDEVTLPPGY